MAQSRRSWSRGRARTTGEKTLNTVKRTEFHPDKFAVLAAIDPNLRIEQIRGVCVAPDGQNIALFTTEASQRIGEKRALGVYEYGKDHAVDTFTEVEGVQLLSGTPGIQNNPARASIVKGLKGLFVREDKNVLVCSKPTGVIGYYLYSSPTAEPIDLTTQDLDFTEVVFLPKPRGYVAREARSNCLWFLPFATAKTGTAGRVAWNMSNALPGVSAIMSLPPRIQNNRAVLCSTLEGDRQCSDTLNLSSIGSSQITSVAREGDVNSIVFRCFASHEVAIIEVGVGAKTLEPGTWQVPTADLPELFGKAGAALVSASAPL
ncbi:hypothetical protein A3F52_03885 [Candidatus Uhrbacteria bacterium RIFCSPHIGHO2_12_FULL_47_11]|nr:MAG: hypothetical protein A3F52_03885 [Candidatus Uhrbacteria bacterium RIFCSPHIGHO2_12_FULL_47_11]